MSNTKIENLTSSSPYLEEVYKKYRERFAQPPWSEVSKCVREDNFSPLAVGTPCPDCNIPLTEAYPRESTLAKISQELELYGAIGKLAIIDGVVAAFNWGYRSTPQQVAIAKYETNKDMQDKVVAVLAPYAKELTSIFYLAECVTGTGYENQKLQTQLVQSTMQQVGSNTIWVVRTNANQKPMVRICENTLQLTRVINKGEDIINNNRILYAGRVSN